MAPLDGTYGTEADLGDGDYHLFAVLIFAPNAVVGPLHPKAMPDILTTLADCEAWLTAPHPEALMLQRPLADGVPHLAEAEALPGGYRQIHLFFNDGAHMRWPARRAVIPARSGR